MKAMKLANVGHTYTVRLKAKLLVSCRVCSTFHPAFKKRGKVHSSIRVILSIKVLKVFARINWSILNKQIASPSAAPMLQDQYCQAFSQKHLVSRLIQTNCFNLFSDIFILFDQRLGLIDNENCKLFHLPCWSPQQSAKTTLKPQRGFHQLPLKPF